MPRTVLPAGNRYTPRGTTKVLFIPLSALPEPGTLTLAVLDATTTVDLTPALVPPITGFNGDQADIPAPDMGTLKTGTVPGEITIAASSLTFYLSKDGPADDVRSVLAQGDEGWLIFADNGVVAGNTADQVRVDVKYGMKLREDLARITIPFSISEIREDIVLP